MNPTFLLWLGAAMATFLGASTVSRAYIDSGKLWVLLASLALYCVGNLMMVRIIRDSGMAIAVSMSSVLQLVLSTAIAVMIFGERPTTLQWTGIALGVMAVALIIWPQEGGR